MKGETMRDEGIQRRSRRSGRRTAVTAVTAGFAAAALTAALLRPARALGGPGDADGSAGGLAVLVGWQDPRELKELQDAGASLVQGVDRDAAKVERAREHLRSAGMLGPVTVALRRGDRLPYLDDMVNRLVVAGDGRGLPDEELLRVLRPGGTAVVGDRELRMPWPPDIDSWGHLLYGAAGNPVSRDLRVGHPAYAQWEIGPSWPRHHDASSAGTAVMVSANGRLFSIRDEAPSFHSGVRQQTVLMAQDAFNGIALWKRPLENWRVWQNRSQPAVVPRRIVAMEDRLYVTLGYSAPVSVLDAATGRELMTLPESEFTSEIIVTRDTIFVSAALAEEGAYDKNLPNLWEPRERWIKAYHRAEGRLLWKEKTGLFPLTLAADSDGLYFHDTDRVVCLDPATGERKWAAAALPFKKFEMHGEKPAGRPGSYGPTLLVQDGVVLYSMTTELTVPEDDMGDGILHAYDAADGRELWHADFPAGGEMCPKDVFVVDGVAYLLSREDKKITGLDVRTGEKRVEFLPQAQPAFFHPRCHRYKATVRYLIPSNQGFELVDLKDKVWDPIFWIRGSCNFGYLPANGLLYAPPGPCACFSDTMLHGTYALAPRAAWMDALGTVDDAERLEKGPAFAEGSGFRVQGSGNDWPTYRADAARRGYIEAPVAGTVAPAWKTGLGGALTAPTVAAGAVFVAQEDRHTLHALDADTGRKRWSFTAGGRIDSPPTIVGPPGSDPDTRHLKPETSLCIFGCHDGFVYGLRAEDGALAWRFRAAPLDLQMHARGQIESLWPVSGSVLVQDGRVWCVAGRSIYLAGGLRLLQLDPATGRRLGETVLDEKDPATGEPVHFDTQEDPGMPVALPDILSGDGQYIYMRSQPFDKDGKRLYFRNLFRNNDFRINNGAFLDAMKKPERHLFSAAGFLDGNWFHRNYFTYANVQTYASGQFHLTRQFYPSGLIMVLDDEKTYTYARQPHERSWIPRTVTDNRLMRTDLKPGLEPIEGKRPSRALKWDSNQSFASDWELVLPVYPRAMVKAAGRVFVAGPPDPGKNDPEELRASWDGEKGGSLLAVSADAGTIEQELKLDAPPVWDGMASAGGRIFIALRNGEVACFKGQAR